MFARKPFLLSYHPLGSDVLRISVAKGVPKDTAGAIERVRLPRTGYHRYALIFNDKRVQLERVCVCPRAVFTLLPTAGVGCPALRKRVKTGCEQA